MYHLYGGGATHDGQPPGLCGTTRFADARIAPRNRLDTLAHQPLSAPEVSALWLLPAPVAVVNAVWDALAHPGGGHLDMPLTPAKIWQALQEQADSLQALLK